MSTLDISLDLMKLDSKETNPDLPIYQKAKEFKAQNIISGNDFKTDKEFMSFVKERYGTDGINRVNIAKFVLQKKKFSAPYDVLLAIASNKPAKVILATAGAGKTTMLQVDIIVSKLIDKITNKNKYAPITIEGTPIKMSRILFLNYNKHNAEPAKLRHESFVRDINSVVKENERISDDIESSTAHAFCRKWLERYSEKLNLDEVRLIDKDDKNSILNAVIEPRWKKYYTDTMPKSIITDIDSLYNYKEESMLNWEQFFVSAKFIDSELLPEFVKSCIEKYEAIKRTLKVFDFIDFIKEFVRLMKTDAEFKQTVTDRYNIVIADEAQDFTALMNEILFTMQTPHTKIIAVGDTDQTIYSFRGVSPDNILQMSKTLSNCDLLTLETNYRCPSKIVEAAKAILNLNILRFDKEIKYVREGGNISFKAYSNENEKYAFLLKYLANRTDTELENTVIAFRNNDSSFILAEEMYYAGIPYILKDTNKPFTNDIFTRIYHVLDALSTRDDITLNYNLWHVLPISKSTWSDIIEENKKHRITDIRDYRFDNFKLPDSFFLTYSTLLQISTQIDQISCSQYIHSIFDYFRKYYYNFAYKVLPGLTDTMKKKQELADLYMERALKFFNRDITFSAAKLEFSRSQRQATNAVTLSTFHALKGLEFSTVIAVDMIDSIFPNYSKIEQLYPVNTAMEEKESENRLCYVLITRAMENLILLYDERNPSVYIQILKDKTKDVVTLDDAIINKMDISVPGDLSSRMRFINRMMSR